MDAVIFKRAALATAATPPGWSKTPLFPINFDDLLDPQMKSVSEQLDEMAHRRIELARAVIEIACHTLRLTEPRHPMSIRYERVLDKHLAQA